MNVVFHDGERLVQRLAGVEAEADHVGKILRASLPTAAQAFLGYQTLAVAATAAADGRVWASLLTGEPGFLRTLDERTLKFAGPSNAQDPFWENVRQTGALGLLVIDLATRRRLRANGTAEAVESGVVRFHITEAFSNCPKYIQR